METAGVVVGVVALAGLFSTCLDLMSTISRCQTYGESYELLMLQLDIEHVLFQRWGDVVGLTTPQCDARLADDRICAIINRTLNCLIRKFQDANALGARYGLRAADDVPTAGFQTLQDEASMGKKARWAVHDRVKFETLISEIRGFNESLNRLLPVPVHRGDGYMCEAAPRRVSDTGSIPFSDLTTEVGSTDDMEDWLERTETWTDERATVMSPMFGRFLARMGGGGANLDVGCQSQHTIHALKAPQATTSPSRPSKGKSTTPQPPSSSSSPAYRPHPLPAGPAAVDSKATLMSHSPPKIKFRKQVSLFVRSIVVTKKGSSPKVG